MAVFFIRAVAVLSLVFAGCGYSLVGHGGFLPDDIQSIGVPEFINRTDRPELEQRITEELLRQLQVRSRRRTTAGREGVDAVLLGEVTSFRSLPVEFNPDGRARTIEVVITARSRLQATSDDRIIWAADHFVFRQSYPVGEEGAEFVDVESLALESVARDFAEAVVTSILEGF
ncbi:MAG: hypothetical protein E2P03_00985 [Acidobacteria bacterium]|nr:MAG: hypothetical protein E2P03_00985 [Acidobacteriota bacterium]